MATVFDPGVATYLSQASNLEKEILANVADQSAVSGWALSKSLNQSPEEVHAALNKLLDRKLLKSDGDGLEGFYFLTQSGYLSRDLF